MAAGKYMIKRMKISVVIPAYNEGAYLEACLRSLMRQTEKPDEIIVVDNNSTDATIAIAKKYPVRIVHEKHQGMIPARNRGFNEAKYEIIAQTDADTILPRNWIHKIKDAFSKDPELIALSGPPRYYDVPDIGLASRVMPKVVFRSYIAIMRSVLEHDCLYGPNKALRKSAWEKVRDSVCLNDDEVHEDIDLTIHLAPLGKIRFDNKLIVQSSFRRWKKVLSYFEYSYRGINSVQRHKKFVLAQYGRRLVKKIMTSL
jgi:glycosyltransferase involved in cell wall biosynthesis